MAKTKALGAGFDAAGRAEWEALVAKELSADEVEGLAFRTEDGLSTPPASFEGEFLGVAAREGAIERRGRVGREGDADPAPRIDAEFAGGADGVLLEVAASDLREGLAVEPADWDGILDALEHPGPLHLRAIREPLAHARAWLEAPAFSGRGRSTLGLDPFSAAAATGDFAGLPDALAAGARLCAEALNHPAAPRSFVLDAAPFSDAGATSAQSLGAIIAGLVSTLRALELQNVDPARAFGGVELCLRLDANFFEQIAALRALRILVERVGHACGVAGPVDVALSAMPAERLLSRRDPWVNMLRQTATTFAAIVGGADAVAVLPFDQELERGSALGRRVARNTPTILVEESHLGAVQDPAAGSWFLDGLTRELAGAGWAFFQEIESEGGLPACMESGWLLARLQSAHSARRKRLATRKLPRTGVSEFARLEEELPAPPRPLPRPRAGAWPRHGFDDDFERLRAAASAQGPAPRVFVARAGALRDRGPRETWVANLLAAGGIEAVGGEPDGPPGEDFAASGARCAILAASDSVLDERGAELVAELAAKGRVFVAARPDDALREAGAAGFVHVGADVVAFLESVLAETGVRA